MSGLQIEADDGRTAAEKLAESILESKYRRHISRSLAVNLAEQELAKGRGPKQAIKQVKGRLHQLLLSFEAEPSEYARLAEALTRAKGAGREEIKKLALQGLALHSSTKERLLVMEHFYAKVFEGRSYKRIVDLGCGLNPLALPWMCLPDDVSYLAVDASAAPGGAVQAFFDTWGTAGQFQQHDLSEGLPQGDFDVALLLKALPTLDRIRDGLGVECIKAVKAPIVVVSFPTRSLGGRAKGMQRNYSEAFIRQANTAGWPYTMLEFPGELVFIVRK